MEQVNIVLKTTDYPTFLQIEGNRRVNPLNVKKIKKSMQIKHLQVPVIVNEKYEIIDGQHRFQACKEAGLPVYYIIVKGYGLKEVHRLNTIGKNWTAFDYLDGYADTGLQDYIEARKFQRKYNFPMQATQSLLLGYNGLAGGDDSLSFRNGNFKIKNLKDAVRKAEMIESVAPFYQNYKNRSFIAALLFLFNNESFDFELFLSKLSLQRDELYDCTNWRQYVLRIEAIYKWKNRDKDNIRFL